MLNVLFFPETKLDCFLAGATRVPYNVMLLILEILTSVYLRMPFSVHQVFWLRKIILGSSSVVCYFCIKWACAIFGRHVAFHS